MLKAKAGRQQNWLPQQVAYGVDTSDSDPKNWKAFGTTVEQQDAKHAVKGAANVSAPGQREQ